MRIHIAREQMALLRSLDLAGRPLWEAIEELRSNPAPPDAADVPGKPGRRELHVRVGVRGFWLQWEVVKDRGETVIEIVLVEEN